MSERCQTCGHVLPRKTFASRLLAGLRALESRGERVSLVSLSAEVRTTNAQVSREVRKLYDRGQLTAETGAGGNIIYATLREAMC